MKCLTATVLLCGVDRICTGMRQSAGLTSPHPSSQGACADISPTAHRFLVVSVVDRWAARSGPEPSLKCHWKCSLIGAWDHAKTFI